MDLRSFPEGLSPAERCDERLKRIENEVGMDLSMLHVAGEDRVGVAEERNCEQMFGHVPLPVGYAGPLPVTFSNGTTIEVHLPLATTEGALVASVNRGCKALRESGSVQAKSVHRGTTRSFAFRLPKGKMEGFIAELNTKSNDWKKIGEATSNHLNILSYDIESLDDHVFLTIACDTDQAMGMNMVTIAAQEIGEWVTSTMTAFKPIFVTVAGNVDSDKKPSKRTHDKGRGYDVTASCVIPKNVITDILRTTPEDLLAVAHAKLDLGSQIAGALGKNLHAANIAAALYLATGQDVAHVVEASLADTSVKEVKDGIEISVRLPAVMVGIIGGGTMLFAQAQCLTMLLRHASGLHACQQLAESIGAAVLAGELSLLAAQATHQLAKAHKELGR